MKQISITRQLTRQRNHRQIREDLTIHTVDMIDEVLRFALGTPKTEEILETPQIWKTDKPATDISAAAE